MTNGNEPINAADPSIHSFAGLTKREYFAAMAMQGILSNDATENTAWDYDIIGKHCAMAADALIKALNETQQ